MSSADVLKPPAGSKRPRLYQYIEIFNYEIPQELDDIPKFRAYIQAMIKMLTTVETIIVIGDKISHAIIKSQVL